MENLLKYSNSPYLKQHESNPVYWQPWNKKTLEIAKKSQKPIFFKRGLCELSLVSRNGSRKF